MSITDILGYVFTTLSFLSVIYSVFNEKTNIFACILVLFALVSFSFLICYLRSMQNKIFTLEVLAKECRQSSAQLLLTYERLMHSKDDFSEKFLSPKFLISDAHYTYKILQSAESTEEKDLECQYVFEISKAPSKGSFDILISQPRGKMLKTVKYKFGENGKKQTAIVEKVVFVQSNQNFSGLWKARVSWDSHDSVQKLTIYYTLKQVYRVKETIPSALLLCPFIYGKRIKNIDIKIEYDKDAECNPIGAGLKLYPYNGRRCRPERVLNFSPVDNSSWAIQTVRCITNAVYIIEITHK